MLEDPLCETILVSCRSWPNSTLFQNHPEISCREALELSEGAPWLDRRWCAGRGAASAWGGIRDDLPIRHWLGAEEFSKHWRVRCIGLAIRRATKDAGGSCFGTLRKLRGSPMDSGNLFTSSLLNCSTAWAFRSRQ